MVGIAVAHALVGHVETAWVFDDGSSDGTASGVAELQRAFPGRVTYVRLDGSPYLQSAVSSIALEALHDEPSADWIWFLDADEFGFRGRLDEALADVAPEVGAVRYNVINFVAPTDLDSNCPQQFARVVHRSEPSISTDVNGETLAQLIESDEMTFFDAAFDTKVIVRRGTSPWITAGAHQLPDGSTVEGTMNPVRFECGHVPFASRDALERRAERAQRVVEATQQADHGWQTRLVFRAAQSGQLEGFWKRHSIGAGADPIVVVDESLSAGISETLRVLESRGVDLARVDRSLTPTLTQSLELTDSLTLRTVDALQEVAAEIVARNTQLNSELQWRDEELERLNAQLESLREDRTRLLDERSRLVGERDALLGSRTWRIASRLARPFSRRR